MIRKTVRRRRRRRYRLPTARDGLPLRSVVPGDVSVPPPPRIIINYCCCNDNNTRLCVPCVRGGQAGPRACAARTFTSVLRVASVSTRARVVFFRVRRRVWCRRAPGIAGPAPAPVFVYGAPGHYEHKTPTSRTRPPHTLIVTD